MNIIPVGCTTNNNGMMALINFSSPYGADDRDPQESVWFDNNGLFSAGKTKAPKTLGLENKKLILWII